MKKNRIWLIIIFMSIAMMGIAVTQVFWIKSNLALDAKNFDNKVFVALNEVNDKLSNDARAEKSIRDKSFDKLTSRSLLMPKTSYMDWRIKKDQFEIQDLSFSLNPSEYLENIKPAELKKMITLALNNQGILLDFQYGVFSNKDSSFIIINDHYVPVLNKNTQSTHVMTNSGLDDTKYKASLLTTEFDSPGSLMIIFPNKNLLLSPTVWPSLFSSLLFTSIILFGFSYTIYIIFNQKKISEMKTDFINNMTHEFKTPIATISLASDSIITPSVIKDESKVKRFISIIKEENSRMLNQVEKVLNIAKLDKKTIELKLVSIDVHELIKKAVDHAKLNAEQKNGQIFLNLQANNYMLVADQTHFSNIIHNILDNALKYTINDPEITVSTRDVANGIELSFKDNGLGMSKEARKHIFDKFYRIPTGNIHNIKGFGLGLAYVKALVEAHQGKVSVKSELGKGSDFILFFPRKNVT
ncbi:MAG TPA: hypothetical protein DCX89_00935 [Saprospirales bacterium]|nr:hypothetical protein [Saprospirales bacterium]HAY70430.1 hypothetical protein [Saprospirales bacterium]HRQ30590.1 HAMP domain-containing sensor histidine kinase [Saprospiraceae bacterium]